MDFRLLNAMIDEALMGNRIDGSWTTQVIQTSLTPYIIMDWKGLQKIMLRTNTKALRIDGVRSMIYLVDRVVLVGIKPRNFFRLRMKCRMC